MADTKAAGSACRVEQCQISASGNSQADVDVSLLAKKDTASNRGYRLVVSG